MYLAFVQPIEVVSNASQRLTEAGVVSQSHDAVRLMGEIHTPAMNKAKMGCQYQQLCSYVL